MYQLRAVRICLAICRLAILPIFGVTLTLTNSSCCVEKATHVVHLGEVDRLQVLIESPLVGLVELVPVLQQVLLAILLKG